MPPAAGTASLTLAALALGAAVYLYFLNQKIQKENQAAQQSLRLIAEHLQDRIDPAILKLNQRQRQTTRQLRAVLESSSIPSAYPSASPWIFEESSLQNEEEETTEAEIAQAMLCSMTGISVSSPTSSLSTARISQVQEVTTEDEEEEEPYDEEELDEEDEEEEEVQDEELEEEDDFQQ